MIIYSQLSVIVTPKALSTFVSGESIETAIMAPPLRMLQDYFMPRSWMSRFARSILSGLWLLPIGGDIFWGIRNNTWAPDIDINYRSELHNGIDKQLKSYPNNDNDNDNETCINDENSFIIDDNSYDNDNNST